MVQSALDYSGAIWDPHKKTAAEKLERVQNRAARWALRERSRGAATVSTMLQQLGWSSLAERRRRQRLTLLWKVLTGAYDVPPTDVGLHLRQSTRPERGTDPNPLKLLLPRASDVSSPLWRATSMRTIADFNALPG